MKVFVSAADQNDREGAKQLLSGCKDEYPRLQKIWADGQYTGSLIKSKQHSHKNAPDSSEESRGFCFVLVSRVWYNKLRRKIAMQAEIVWNEFLRLPSEAQQSVADYISFLESAHCRKEFACF